jgi:ubiquinone/menaquinone biosynthesis C-methylase UbiE
MRAGYFTAALRESAIAKAHLRPGMIVADVGAGTGFMAAGLVAQVARVHVLDGCAAMLEVARRNLAEHRNVEYHLADGVSLPLADGSLDVAFANMYLHHCPDPLAAIREMVRILRPGGRLVVTDMDTHPYAWFRTEMSDLWLGFERDLLRAWFEQAGLGQVRVECTGQCCRSQRAGYRDGAASISVFVASGTRIA